MKIAHLCLSCFYIDGRTYQENELIREHVLQGHDVQVIASTENLNADGKLTYEAPSSYIGAEGAKVTRLPYSKIFPQKLSRKLRIHPGVFKALESFSPDAILFHGLCGWEILTAAKYKRAYPDTILYADSHEDWNNSARSFLSREILHKRFYGPVLRRAQRDIEKLLCISLETIDFVEEVYKIPRSRLEFFPLAGHPLSSEAYGKLRSEQRSILKVNNKHIIFVQSGKLTRRKKLLETLQAFSIVDDPRFRLYIAGVLTDDIRSQAEKMIAADDRIKFVGWQSPEQLTAFLAAADIYLQPGTQSVTMQNSLCAHCAVILDDVKSHSIYMRGNGWLLNSEFSLKQAFTQVSECSNALSKMGGASYEIAREMLDYKVLAQRVLK